MNTQKKLHRTFYPVLRNISFYSFILKLIPIPFSLLTATLLSDLAAEATSQHVPEVFSLSAKLIFLLLGMKVFEVLSAIACQKASSQALHICKQKLYRQFLSNPLYRLYSADHGDTMEKLHDDFNTVTGKILSLYPSFLTGMFTFAVYFFFLARQSLGITLILTVISLIQFLPPVIVSRFLQINYDQNRDIEAQLSDFTLEGYHGFVTIKLYHLKKWWLTRLEEIHKNYMKVGNRAEATATAEYTLLELTKAISTYGTYGIVGLFILSGHASLDTGVQAIALSAGFFQAVRQISALLSDFAVAKTAETRLSDFFSDEEEIDHVLTDTMIQLQHVSYFYNNKQILSDTSISFLSDGITLIKGTNGIGKSTLFRLLTGQQLCTKGQITIGDISVSELGSSHFPKQIFYLPQEDAAFRITAMELYQMLLTDTLSTVSETAKHFGLSETLLCSSKICDLSGGERKKVFLSLAFTLNPSILLLDEPTNSLDEAGKQILLKFLASRTKPTLIITHETLFDDISANCFCFDERKTLLCQ